ncbi:MAG: deoxyribose-phosphate aldolase [Erysipelotrichaceae bacterium]|nr:deoxyribose-phosphate aldolase [Erysipelotrichaceae bacterium]MBR5755127.1 deoxyribose-phosphate aldolase [Erysipelotrichaceae bacterium]
MKLAKYIDHTLLKADASLEAIKKLCDEAREYDFKSVCVNTCNIEFCRKQLEGSDVLVCCVIGFPLGAMTTESKVFETRDAISKGADEVDMVINIGRLKDNDLDYVTNEIRQIKEACGDKVLKVIIETCLLTDEEKVNACRCILEAGADFVKTSTGFSTGGATFEDVALLKKTVKDNCLIKAAGGVKTKEDFLKMIELGANRIGTSSGTKLIEKGE